MPDQIGALIDRILEEEGDKFTNDPADAGGATKWGVTQATLADFRGLPASVSDVENLTRSDAWACYFWKFVRAPKFDQVAKLSMPVAAKLIDAGVNLGPPTVATWLQRCLNAFNLEAKQYPDIDADGRIGPTTLSALGAFLTWRGKEGEGVLLEALNCLQGEKYIELAEKRSTDERFVYGWIKNRVAA